MRNSEESNQNLNFMLAGWGKSELNSGNGGQGSVKHQIINLISATRMLMRSKTEKKKDNFLKSSNYLLVPLIGINIIAIIFLIVFG